MIPSHKKSSQPESLSVCVFGDSEHSREAFFCDVSRILKRHFLPKGASPSWVAVDFSKTPTGLRDDFRKIAEERGVKYYTDHKDWKDSKTTTRKVERELEEKNPSSHSLPALRFVLRASANPFAVLAEVCKGYRYSIMSMYEVNGLSYFNIYLYDSRSRVIEKEELQKFCILIKGCHSAIFDVAYIPDGIAPWNDFRTCDLGNSIWNSIGRHLRNSCKHQLDLIPELWSAAWLKAIKTYPNHPGYTFENWCRETCRYPLKIMTRAENGRRHAPLDSIAPQVLACKGEEVGTRLASTESIEVVLERLPTMERDVLWLKFWNDMTFKQIAKTLGISQHAAESRYYRGRKKMRQALAKDRIT